MAEYPSIYQYPGAGLSNVGSYQVSGIPHLTGGTLLSSSFTSSYAEQKISFEKVSRTITVINNSDVEMRVHFRSAANPQVISGSHYVPLSGSKTSITLNVKAKEVYVSLASNVSDCNYFVVSELTSIRSQEMFELTGSGIDE